MSEVKLFIQNVHNFRDEGLIDLNKPPIEHVALFDEAQRAWDLHQTVNFMHRKRNHANFRMSEPEFLISCLNRHSDWAVVVCLVGGGQEINTGEAGISEWIDALERSFPSWHIYISPKLTDSEYGTEKVLNKIKSRQNVTYKNELHLSVSMRSFRAEHVSLLVKQILDLQPEEAKKTLAKVREKYPIVITRYATSPTGVRGLMMLTGETADRLGVADRLSARQSIIGGARYLVMMREALPDRIPEPDRTWLALADYNQGQGHLEDARRIAQARGGNPVSWADVKEALPYLGRGTYAKVMKYGYARGAEALHFAENIRNYYDILLRLEKEHKPLLFGSRSNRGKVAVN